MAVDPVGTAFVVGKWSTPKAGDELVGPDGDKRRWVEVESDAVGKFAPRSGHLLLDLRAEAETVVRLDLSGHASASINGELRAGDPYGFGYVHTPVALRKGSNELLIQLSGRSPLKIALAPIKSAAEFDLADVTVPDLIVGESEASDLGVVVRNGTAKTLTGLTVEIDADGTKTTTKLAPLPPLTYRKEPLSFRAPSRSRAGTMELGLKLRGEAELDAARLTLKVVPHDEPHQRTFISGIDNSIQYYGVNPPRGQGPRPGRALVLSLHGAGVEAIGQARAYASKPWAYVIAPTNRRPFGFDWEDWGRMDAAEVFGAARERFQTDPTRSYLTGHSMGGHGTWIFGATFPSRFAAIAPSAGWISMSSYAGAKPVEPATKALALFRRASASSDTLALANNYKSLGVYVLHGDADDNVPVTQARRMKEVLEPTHGDFHYFEQPKAGHWWSTPENEGAGAACVDWPPIFDLFARRRVPNADEILSVDFTTANPCVSAESHWLAILSQRVPMAISRVKADYRPGPRRYDVTTENVSRLALLAPKPKGEPFSVGIDGQTIAKIPNPDGRAILLRRKGDAWSVEAETNPPRRFGPFKEAFRHRMIFVYGTKGTPEENAWALAKARYDAETWYYRGNGSVDVLPDVEYKPAEEFDKRSVILYGHSESHALWKELLGESPVQVKRGSVSIGGRTLKGDDLAVLFVRPRIDSEESGVAAISGTGLAGLRRTDRLPYFVSGVAYPDVTVLKADPGAGPDRGLVAAGFFGDDGSVESGDFAFETR